MTKPVPNAPEFNLWTEPWITVERPAGGTGRLGVAETLLRAQEYLAIYEPSPLAIVGIHRLLIAILQAALAPQKESHLVSLWQAGRFSPEAIEAFGREHMSRFGLFSADAPFLQSAHLPLQPGKGDNVKTVAYLAVETPSGSAATHFHHGHATTKVFCPACAAIGLLTVPPFATSGGATMKPSINGVPPVYVLPSGKSLFESLAASLLLPQYQPKAASAEHDRPWWARAPLVGRSAEVHEVGYLQSLTFPARRMRLHPQLVETHCTRCGRFAAWGVRTMVFDMGESRPKDAAFWNDPFAAYRLPERKSEKAATPVRPRPSWALWREYATLFLKQPTLSSGQRTMRPSVLEQLAELQNYGHAPEMSFRCIGLRTDMKAKVFEWTDASFDVPPALLNDAQGGLLVESAIQFAGDCAQVLSEVFRRSFGGGRGKQERHRALKSRMLEQYWANLAQPFRSFVLAGVTVDERTRQQLLWADQVVREGRRCFELAAATLGDDAANLRQRVLGQRWCETRLGNRRKEYVV